MCSLCSQIYCSSNPFFLLLEGRREFGSVGGFTGFFVFPSWMVWYNVFYKSVKDCTRKRRLSAGVKMESKARKYK